MRATARATHFLNIFYHVFVVCRAPFVGDGLVLERGGPLLQVSAPQLVAPRQALERALVNHVPHPPFRALAKEQVLGPGVQQVRVAATIEGA